MEYMGEYEYIAANLIRHEIFVAWLVKSVNSFRAIQPKIIQYLYVLAVWHISINYKQNT